MRINLQAKEKLWYRLKEGHFIPNQMNAETPRHILVNVLIIKNKTNSGEINQDGGVEGRALTPSCESTRITIGCWTIIDRKTLDFTKEDTPRPRTEEKPQ